MNKKFDDKQLYPLLLQNDFSKVVDFLERYGLNSVDRGGRNFLINCIAEGKNEFAIRLISMGIDVNQKDKKGLTPFMMAVLAKNREMIDILIKNDNVDVQAVDHYGKNALRWALQNHVFDNNFLISLVNLGIDPFKKDNTGCSSFDIMEKFASGVLTIGGKKLNIEPVIDIIKRKYPDLIYMNKTKNIIN